ncbi:HEPN domain protein [Marvinbryantia formatexigens DSM 14469]|uniref:HEPN domain protein n=1 Tax=Marvinbryantia formatexigens DSM 14469 TaxID=478749 RepID=C6LAE2_9FIRM|nr:HEPN domain-containing protein [Marvinbryantia formatexigens]EET62549.1 HEPN domain protein [Marvinbryantia formatexigens DSM 14469]UWO24930.1 HEPN domain-containing protein [Marvinbryantia formatexigens DSM 14469]SDG24207.1 Uncharacterized protein, contains HEPN domain, UPF0332 family [Marvinbryantia formatexigens]
MSENYYKDLERVRIERAGELVTEAEELLLKGLYKSANNRAFYAIEKAIKALLANIKTDAETHNGAVKLFNYHFVHNGEGIFTPGDYKMIIKADQIRNASDYDDFYIASKEESRVQVENAGYIVEKVKQFLGY